MTILDVVQRASVLCGLSSPSGAVSSTDINVQQMVLLATQEGEETASSFDWRQLKIPGQIIGDGTTTYWFLPDDFERLLPGEAFYSSSYPSIPLIGPLSDEEFLAAKALPVLPIRPIYRLIANDVEIWPALASGEIVNTQYRSKSWIKAADGTLKTSFTLDNDTSVFPERILSLGVIWRWKRTKGLDYAEEYRTYQMERDKMAGHDAGNRVIYMSGRQTMPDNYWPGIISVTP
jgi:hypothetical protein